jgi:hypothetical protein
MEVTTMNDDLIELTLTVSEDQGDEERLDELTLLLINSLQEYEVESVSRKGGSAMPSGAKGDPITVGAVVLGVSVATLPSIIAFLQNWVNERRRVVIESPNGYKVDFVPDKKYSEAEILSLAQKLNRLK